VVFLNIVYFCTSLVCEAAKLSEYVYTVGHTDVRSSVSTTKVSGPAVNLVICHHSA